MFFFEKTYYTEFINDPLLTTTALKGNKIVETKYERKKKDIVVLIFG